MREREHACRRNDGGVEAFEPLQSHDDVEPGEKADVKFFVIEEFGVM